MNSNDPTLIVTTSSDLDEKVGESHSRTRDRQHLGRCMSRASPHRRKQQNDEVLVGHGFLSLLPRLVSVCGGFVH